MNEESSRDVVVLGAASAIGIRPYEEGGEERALHQAPVVLRGLGVAELAVLDLGDVRPPPYRDFFRPSSGVRNEPELVQYLTELGGRVEAALSRERRVLLLGGDCSIVLGALLGASAGGRRVGLVYVDAHADFATPSESETGSAASMCLALAVGRGESSLARLRGDEPLVRGSDVVLIGRRDPEETYAPAALETWGVLDIPDPRLRELGFEKAAEVALERVAAREVDGFWIHLDADVIDPAVMSAVDSPEPGGPRPEELARLLTPLLRHPRALGLQVTIYDPVLDTDRRAGRALAALLKQVYGSPATGAAPSRDD